MMPDCIIHPLKKRRHAPISRSNPLIFGLFHKKHARNPRK